MLKFLLPPGLGSWELEFKSLIIVLVGFQNLVCCLVWAVDQQQFWKTTITIINDLKYNSLSQETEETSTPTRPGENIVLTREGLQERNTQLLDGTAVEKYVKQQISSNWNLPIGAWNMIFRSIANHGIVYSISGMWSRSFS